MKIAEKIEALSDAHDACRMVAFADLSSQMVLCSATKEKVGQEKLDALCKKTVNVFSDPFETLSTSIIGGLNEAIVAGPDGVLICLRSETVPDDALCCMCDDTMDLDAFLADSRTLLAEISEDEPSKATSA